ncbi:putative peptide transporter ptr2 [Neolecta irregularis DAH-3]|uniref:Putative peptide transporter ptr2 n=1 Tax=Neolecta irregularis (strain DAH-3) TaxID=1198029 RepID=A0A1U7LQ19_NEOID|nr:putative peptide transporter ptr2 [Neolecta irregularis DAH-3]|eukprot:OLL24766.1 putative peptide transporter ptr2 [Neolecta irregularis DAH-3]
MAQRVYTSDSANLRNDDLDDQQHDITGGLLGNTAAESSLYDHDTKDDLSDENHIEPTEQELSTLNRVADALPLGAWLVVVIEFCERFMFYGTSGPFQNYIQNSPHSKPLGALGLGQRGATMLNNFWNFWCYFTPIFGAIIADQYLGRYRTICLFGIFYLIGSVILFSTSFPAAIESGASLGGFITAIIIMGLGAGGIKPNVSPLVAEQCSRTQRTIKVLPSGKRVIIDPAVTAQRVFMTFYWAINVGSLSSMATTQLRKDVGYWAAFLLPLCMFVIGLLVLFLGRSKYIVRPPQGSVIPRSFQALWIGFVNGCNMDKAKPSVIATRSSGDKALWDDHFIDELKRALTACRIFLFFPIYWVCYFEMTTNLISQAGQMKTGSTPNDFLQNLNPITLIIFIPIFDRLVYPGLRKVGIRMLPMTRIILGFFTAAASMAYAAGVQHMIYTTGPCFKNFSDGCTENNVNVWIQTPAYVLIALSEIFASITGLEYAYTKAPSSMKSFVMAMFLLTYAGGAILGIALASVAVDPKLVWMYTAIAVTAVISGISFWACFKHLNGMEDEMNALEAKGQQAVPVGSIVQSKKSNHHNLNA